MESSLFGKMWFGEAKGSHICCYPFQRDDDMYTVCIYNIYIFILYTHKYILHVLSLVIDSWLHTLCIYIYNDIPMDG